MNRQMLRPLRVLVCIFGMGVALYAHIDEKNDVTSMQLTVPLLEKEVKVLVLENERLEYEIDRFESPIHLMELLRKPEFSYLKYPSLDEVIILSKKGEELWQNER